MRRQRNEHGVGMLLREWREQRGLSQLQLSLRADISARHLSFVETGRSRPSRDMITTLAEVLDVPLRGRNALLLAAGLAPSYPETPLGAPELSEVRSALRQVLVGHEPYPALVLDRHWNLVEANAALALLTAAVAPALLEPPANVLRASLHPDGLAPHIANLGAWRTHLLDRLRRQVAATQDGALAALYEELCGYPCDQPKPEPERPAPGAFGAVLRLRHPLGELAFFSTVTVFGTPLDVTVAELAIESFFPADAATAAALHGLATVDGAAAPGPADVSGRRATPQGE